MMGFFGSFPRAPLAQLDRATDYESVGRPFESGGAHHFPFSDLKGVQVTAGLGRLVAGVAPGVASWSLALLIESAAASRNAACKQW